MDELDEASRFEAQIWGASDPTPRSLLAVFAQHGGLVLGAFDQDRLVGLSVGIPGLDDDGASYLHSHLLAVEPDYRRRRLGEALKRAQWDYAARRGFSYVGWTYDPLIETNAWFNLGVLGARVDSLVSDAYGRLHDVFNHDLPTHRFWVIWDPAGEPRRSVAGERREMAIPRHVMELRRDKPDEARRQSDEWFQRARRWWSAGWRVVGVDRDQSGVQYQWALIGPHEEESHAD